MIALTVMAPRPREALVKSLWKDRTSQLQVYACHNVVAKIHFCIGSAFHSPLSFISSIFLFHFTIQSVQSGEVMVHLTATQW